MITGARKGEGIVFACVVDIRRGGCARLVSTKGGAFVDGGDVVLELLDAILSLMQGGLSCGRLSPWTISKVAGVGSIMLLTFVARLSSIAADLFGCPAAMTGLR